jgi:hypothetical protein
LNDFRFLNVFLSTVSICAAKNSVKAAYAYQAALALEMHAYCLDSEQDPEAESKRKVLFTKSRQLLNDIPSFINPNRTIRDIEAYSVRRAKDRLAGKGHPVLDGMEIMYLFACYDSMPLEAAQNILKLLERLEKDVKEKQCKLELEDQCRASLIRGCIMNALKRIDGTINV